MAARGVSIVPLGELVHGQEADLFALMTAKEQLTTRDGKPYFKVGFRDARREVSFPIWNDSPWARDCRDAWEPGLFYKIRAVYRETNYGPQLEIRKIREATEADGQDGFDPNMCRPCSRFDPREMARQLVGIARDKIADAGLRQLVLSILESNQAALLTAFAARRHHHAFVAGLLEHTLSVTRNAVFLAEHYVGLYGDLARPLDTDLVVAGAILHDVGKLRELEDLPIGAHYTDSGELIGHMLQGRDMVREAAAGVSIDAHKLLLLEHVIVSHQRLPEWGSPKPPMIPEALLVHYADDVDAKFNAMVRDLSEDKPYSRIMGRR